MGEREDGWRVMHFEKDMLKRFFLRGASLGCLAVLMLWLGGCSEPAVKVGGDKPVVRQPKEVKPVPVVLPVIEDSNRWLIVKKVSSGGDGGWATGAFDRGRNKIVIETHDVESFVVDTSRVTINWKKLVILRIDGRNSELRKRDYQLLNFSLDHSGAWVVEEPGK